MVRKAMLSATTVFLTQGTQFVSVLFILLFSLIFHMACDP